MIVRSNKLKDGLNEAKYEGDHAIFLHAQRINPVVERAAILRKETDKGWSHDKSFKLVATIPILDALTHPEWDYDSEALFRWLRTDYGQLFKISDP